MQRTIEFLREVKAYWDQMPKDLSFNDEMRALSQRFPDLCVDDIKKVTELTLADAERLKAEIAQNKIIEQVYRRHMRRGDELLFDVLRRGAEVGDREAEAILSWEGQLNSPEGRVARRLFNAAVHAHPDWSHLDQPGHYACPPPDHPEHEDHALTAWFERTYPAEAARITAEALAN